MQYRTRGNSTPHGKPRIYMTGHPDDFKTYFSEYADLILQKNNSVIYYDENPDFPEPADSFHDHLFQMQLIVLLVTSKLLLCENFAMKEVFPYAIKNNIPVLPLLLDSGIEKKFNELCGDLQFLNPNDRDVTAISFEEKLSKFLNSVLVSDKLIKQIRMSFDAYIFMSYRKKDRGYANELMKLIHDNDFCQSVAIWYDEFLVPGRNFNDAIKEALEKSQLFALVVTPNLVNEENYVKSIEYPMAIEAGKPILPAEMESVDYKKLAEDYPAIPDCLSPSKPETISELLMQSLAHIAKIHHENEPQHNFFMGLAYLNGIDVEVSHDRALLLIQSAADAGLPEAVKKLSDMYFYGDGIERNTEKALSLQEKLTTLLCDAYESELEEESALVYLDALYEYSCNLYLYGQLQKAVLKKIRL